jgi:hypothetical protein
MKKIVKTVMFFGSYGLLTWADWRIALGVYGVHCLIAGQIETATNNSMLTMVNMILGKKA